MRPVSVVGIGQVPVRKQHEQSLRQLGSQVVQQAMADAGVDDVQALYLGNMLADELQGQKHLAALVADEAGLEGVEALQVRAATASGAAALRTGFLAVASGAADRVVVAGVEKMSAPGVTSVLAKALDAEREVPDGATLIGQNAHLMQLYQERYRPPPEALATFAVNAHRNAAQNPYAIFQNKQVTVHDVLESRLINAPIRLFDCAPICEGAAAIVLAPSAEARTYTETPVSLSASTVATDRFRLADRVEPLRLRAAERSAHAALEQARLTHRDLHLFEVHDAFTIMTCLLVEAVGFAEPGQGWRLALEGEIALDGKVPLTTFGGLKARGHPIGASALYQVCEIVLQLTGRAGASQVPGARVALMQSVGGAAGTVISHIFAVP
ncbi:MAG: thiolase C-terminal domain-containing protein [Chloroflexota bacterium]